MTFSYVFEYYDKKWRYMEDCEYKYDATSEEIANAIASIYATPKQTLDQQMKTMWDELVAEEAPEILQEMEFKTFDELYDYAKTQVKSEKTKAADIVAVLLGDVEYFAEKIRDELKDYFEDDARQEFKELI